MNLSHLFVGGSTIAFALALLFAFTTGSRDASAIVATVVSSRVMTPHLAFGLCALCGFLGAVFLGSAVASTIGRTFFTGAANGGSLLIVIATALLAASLWGQISTWRGWPTSGNHALTAGLTGATWGAWGAEPYLNRTLDLIFLFFILSPLIGCALSATITWLLRWSGQYMNRQIKPYVDAAQIAGCIVVACVNGASGGQMAMGVAAAATGSLQGDLSAVFAVPTWIRLVVGVTISAGVLFGGHRILHKLGMRFYPIRDMQGVGSQIASALMVSCFLSAGFPSSTTQVISGSILGAGIAKNARAVRWHVAREIALAWALTFPLTGALAYVLSKTLVGLGVGS